MKYRTCVGIDTHSTKNEVFALDTDTGEAWRATLSADPRDLGGFLRSLPVEREGILIINLTFLIGVFPDFKVTGYFLVFAFALNVFFFATIFMDFLTVLTRFLTVNLTVLLNPAYLLLPEYVTTALYVPSSNVIVVFPFVKVFVYVWPFALTVNVPVASLGKVKVTVEPDTCVVKEAIALIVNVTLLLVLLKRKSPR